MELKSGIAESVVEGKGRKEGREGRKEGRRNKKNGEMPRSEESWLFVKESDRKKASTGPN